MSGQSFRFKEFEVKHSRSAMKVGTDGVLLGSWFDAGSDGCNILDIGAGTGLIALMAAQRNPQAVVDAVECDPGSCLDAADNFSSSPWKSALNLYSCTIQEYSDRCGKKYDRIVSNPPYFSNSLKNPNEGRRMARHTDNLSFPELLDAVRKLLSPDGVFSVILPAGEARIFNALAEEKGLFAVRVLLVYPTPASDVKRVAAEFTYRRGPFSTEKLTVEDGGRHLYSEDYRRLTKDFYLDF